MADQKSAGKVIDLMVALRESLAGMPVTGDPAARPFLDYDRKYDMAASGIPLGVDVGAVTVSNATTCERRDSNPHGSPHQILSLGGAPKASGARGTDEEDSTTERHPATPIAAGSTTDSTTRRPFDYGATQCGLGGDE